MEETKELKIIIPEGQEIDWQESAKQEKIVFKQKDTKPRSWKEYCKKSKGKSLFYINENGIDTEIGIDYAFRELDPSVKNSLPSKVLAKAFLAMMQLMSLRQAWIGDWVADWRKCNVCVAATNNAITTAPLITYTHPLSFPTAEMANDFMNCFKDLLEIAKPLI